VATLISEARREYVAGKYKKAAKQYRAVIKEEPGNAYAHQGLAQCLNRFNQFDEAAEECRRTLELDPGLAIPHAILGGIYLRLQRYEESEAALRKAIDLDPACAEAHISLGATLTMQGYFQEATANLQRALALKPDSGITHYNLSVVYARQKQHSAARKEAYRALRIEPSLQMMEWVVAAALRCFAEYRVLFFLFWVTVLLLPYFTRSFLTAPLVAFTMWYIVYGARSDLRSGKHTRGVALLSLAVILAVLYVYNLICGFPLGSP
jgi:tetratricopeptide (TPR) repeat protein